MYNVLNSFRDLHTGKYYRKGEKFPCEGVSLERLEELSTDKNRRKIPLIMKVEENKPKRRSKNA